jgi:hypothetical protein
MNFEQLFKHATGTIRDSYFVLPALPVQANGQWDGIALVALASSKNGLVQRKSSEGEPEKSRILSGCVLSVNHKGEGIERALTFEEISQIQSWLYSDGERFSFQLVRPNRRCYVWLRDVWDSENRDVPVPPEDLRTELLKLLPTAVIAQLYDAISGGYWSKYIARPVAGDLEPHREV